jgi:hypothetical protein
MLASVQPAMSMARLQRWSAVLARAVSLAVLLVGIGFAAYAGVQWLQTAHWQPLTVNGALASSPGTREWIGHPRSWLGLHRVVSWFLRVPIFLLVTALGIALVMLTAPVPAENAETGATWSPR